MKYHYAKPCQYFSLTKMRKSCINCALRISMLAKYIEIPEFCYDMDNLILFKENSCVCLLRERLIFIYPIVRSLCSRPCIAIIN